MDDDKKVSAAIAAVNRYMEMEASEDGRRPILRNGDVASRVNLWGVSGRQDQMRMRTLMQLRTFNK